MTLREFTKEAVTAKRIADMAVRGLKARGKLVKSLVRKAKVRGMRAAGDANIVASRAIEKADRILLKKRFLSPKSGKAKKAVEKATSRISKAMEAFSKKHTGKSLYAHAGTARLK